MANEQVIQSLYNAFFAYLISVNPTVSEGSTEYLAIQNWCSSFSESIGGAIEGGSSGIIPTDFVKKIGDSMQGLLKANNGFEAGAFNSVPSFKIEKVGDLAYIRMLDDVDIVGKSLLYNGNSLLSVNAEGVVSLGAGTNIASFDFSNKALNGILSATIGNGKVSIGDTGILVDTNEVYHAGNCNNVLTDWSAFNLSVGGKATIAGNTTVSGVIVANNGFSFGSNNVSLISSSSDHKVSLSADMLVGEGINFSFFSGLSKINEDSNGNLCILSGKALSLTAGENESIRLMSGLANDNGDLEVISKFGKANFLRGASLGVADVSVLDAVNYGALATDKGLEVLNFVKFKNTNTGIMSVSKGLLSLLINNGTAIGISQDGSNVKFSLTSLISGAKYLFDKDTLTNGKFAIYNSSSSSTPTYMAEGIIYLGDNGDQTNLIGHYFQNRNDGIVVNSDIISDRNLFRTTNYSDGFAGSGLGIDFANSTITSDFLVVRRRLRVFEFEITKTSATQGDLFVTSSCSGDHIQEII